jgi:hypothetical protein
MKVLCDRIKVSHVQEPMLSINSEAIQVGNKIYVSLFFSNKIVTKNEIHYHPLIFAVSGAL